MKSYRYTPLILLGVVYIRLTASTLVYEFTALEWEWPNDTMRADYIARGLYSAEACQPSGLKVNEQGTIFLTVPRLRYATGVPAGLNTVRAKTSGSKEGILSPYPDWETNELGNCNALQDPMSMEIDPRTGYIYVIDVGRVGIMDPTGDPVNLCPAKIMVFDPNLGNRVVRIHEFPDDVVSMTGNFLNDIVLDYVDPEHPEVRYAYISDTYGEQIVVFDFTTNTSWSYKHQESMSADDDRNVTINGVTYTFDLGINGISLSPTFNYVYYCAIGSKKLWQIPTWVLRWQNSDFASYVRLVGSKKSNSDALSFGHRAMYYAALEYDAVYRWEIEKDILQQGVAEGEVILQTETVVAQNWETMQWPDGMGFGNANSGLFYFLTEKAQLFHSGTLDFKTGPNFRIFQTPVNDSCYLNTDDNRYEYFPHMGIIG